ADTKPKAPTSSKTPITMCKPMLAYTSAKMSGVESTCSGVLPYSGMLLARKLQSCATTLSAVAADNSPKAQCLSRRHQRKNATENTSGTANHKSAISGTEMEVMRMACVAA